MDRHGPDELRVGTLNIFGHHGPWKRRRELLTAGFPALGIDILALQEGVRNEGYDQAREILGESYDIAHQNQGKLDDVGIAIASRWPFRAVREVDLGVTTRIGNAPTFALLAEVDVPEPFGPILMATYPSEYRPGCELDRERQAVAAARLLESHVSNDRPHAILASDLNADLDAASMRFWTGRQSLEGESVCYRDAWESVHPGQPGPTFTPGNPLMAEANWDWPFRQIDHVMVRCSTHGLPTLHIRSCERFFVEPLNGVTASDHYGVVASLTPPPRSESS